jgi:DivIVA domain-containing protein
VTSQGQRFRRRALRRGYKVDEVDAFLDRVEATLAGEQSGAPVGAQEVHDVVFRVRFGGYDEWQVDLHLDRVERQLAEFEDRSGRGSDSRIPERMQPEPMRGDPMQSDRMSAGGRAAPPTERLPAPVRDDRQFGRDDQYAREDPYARPERMQQPQLPQRPQLPGPDPYGRYDEPGYGQQQQQQQQQQQRPPAPGGYDTGGYDAFEPGRHGKTDMTAEIRMPERGGYGGPAPMSAPPMSGPPMGGPPMGGGSGGSPELYRVDQLRRTFQPRRFGSGYDPAQVDRLFESILNAMTGRGPMPVPENELDTLQFGLVPGGYFEAEVDAALREVQDILMRRR